MQTWLGLSPFAVEPKRAAAWRPRGQIPGPARVAGELGALQKVPPWKKSPTRSAGSAPACTVDLHGRQTPGTNGRFHGLKRRLHN